MISPFLVIVCLCTAICIGQIGYRYKNDLTGDKFQKIIGIFLIFISIPSIFIISYFVRHEIEAQYLNDIIKDVEIKKSDVKISVAGDIIDISQTKKDNDTYISIFKYLYEIKRNGLPRTSQEE